jgi:hypothetical protein
MPDGEPVDWNSGEVLLENASDKSEERSTGEVDSREALEQN